LASAVSHKKEATEKMKSLSFSLLFKEGAYLI